MMANLSYIKFSSSDNDTIDYSCLMTPSFRNVQLITSIILFVVTLYGNSLILASLIRFPKQFKGSLFMFIGNLAAADFMLGLSMVLFIAEEIAPALLDIWCFCVAKTITFVLPFFASMLFMLSISIDRYMAVMFPFKHLLKTTKKKMFIVWCILIWTIAILTSIGLYFTLRHEFSGDAFVCRIGAMLPSSHSFIASCVLLLFLTINAVLYGIVVRKIQTSKLSGCSALRKNVIKTRLMIIVFILFILFYLPFLICCVLVQTASSVRQDVICVREYIAVIARTNATLNWIVYGLDNRKFRIAFKSLLPCRSCVCRTSTSTIPSISERFKSISNDRVIKDLNAPKTENPNSNQN